MKFRIDVEFKASFDYEVPDEDFTDVLVDDEIDRLIETLSDRTNNYWNDAVFDVVTEND